MVVLWAWLCRGLRGRLGIARRPVAPRFGPSRVSSLRARALSQRARLQRLRTEVLRVLMWGAAAWHMRKEVLRRAAGTLIRMASICLKLFRSESESCVDRQTRTWREAKAQVTASWGTTLVAVVATCAVAAISRLSGRPASRLSGRPASSVAGRK